MPAVATIALTQSQADFISLQSTFSLFCGGFGSGKSFTMGFNAVSDAFHSSSCIIGVYEPAFDLIRTTAVPNVSFFLDEFGVRYKENKQDHMIYTSSSGIGDFMFKSMDNPDILVSYENYRSHIDELDTLDPEKAEKAFFKIIGRTRQNPNDLPKEHRVWSDLHERWEAHNRVNVYTTPEGFRFCNKMWGEENSDPDFQMVRGDTRENPHLPQSYIDNLKRTYPDALLKAYMEGRFVNLASGSVYTGFNADINCSTEQPRQKETIRFGLDFNVNKCAAVGYVVRGDEWHAVCELHGIRDTTSMIQEIKERWGRFGHKIIVYPDATGVKRSSSNSTAPSDIALLDRAGFQIIARATNPLIKDRVTVVNKAFADKKLFINRFTCPETFKCITQQAYDKYGDPDKKSGYDHQCDAAGYPIAYEFRLRKPSFFIPFSFVKKR